MTRRFFNLRTVKWCGGVVSMVDQTKLPGRIVYVKCRTVKDVARAIESMVVRGAPAIGVAAAMGLALTAYRSRAKSRDALLVDLESASALLESTRPTAVNLFWAISEIMEVARASPGGVEEVKEAIVKRSIQMAEEDVQANMRIGEYGSTLISDGDTVLTHCNAGALATVGYGTALAPIRTSISQGKSVKVYATETRPRLQGARLTTFELLMDKIPVTLITDGMVGYAMSRGLIRKVIVGADRIVVDGVFNKIGTYTIAIAAKHHNIPFYVAAPISTFDPSRRAESVKIEERDPKEVTHILNVRIVPKGVDVLNPAFDLTPINLVDAIITERGVIHRPDQESLSKFMEGIGR
ncbi:MAG: S-methyl-5-thioribose-1-phosphate isomerase [Candidatus Bathyarchaeia archaeon]|nr:S-methyl-5-thioribose-1-phosphate isomerase [Candidatus Bathyarchaeota archaeon]